MVLSVLFPVFVRRSLDPLVNSLFLPQKKCLPDLILFRGFFVVGWNDTQ